MDKMRIKKVGGTRNVPLDLQIIAEEAQTSKTYKELLEAIRQGTSQKDLPNSHPGKENAGADALSRMGCEDSLAPDISRNFFNSRETKVDKVRIKKVGGTRNVPLDLQIIAEEAQTSKTYKELLEA